MALSVGDLVAYLKVDDSDFTGKLDGAGGKFAVFGAAAAAATVAVGVALYKVGSTFDDVSDTIRVGTGATGTALDGLVGSAKNIGREVPANFSDIGVAVADLNTRLGLTGQPLEAMATQFLNLSRITGTDLSSNIQGLTRVFGDWSIATDKQPEALDAVFRASQATGVGVDKLGQQVVQFGAPMRQLGFSFEETLAMLGSFDKSGVNTELVMGSMRIALGKMARAGEEPVETFKRVSEQIKNAGDAGTANALALDLFGAKAGPDMAAAIREGRFELGGLVEQIAGGSDTINAAAADTASFAESWQVFKNRVLLAIEPIATRFFNALGDGMEWMMSTGVPAVSAVAAVLSTALSPALSTVAGAVTSLTGFLREHSTIVTVVAAVIAAVLVPHLVALGVAATVSAVKQVAAWLMTQASAIGAAAVHSAQVVGMVAKWLLLGAQSLLHAAKVVAAWVMTSAGAFAAGVVMLAQSAAFVARWAFMGVQSLLHAAKVAAAWLIAMGPIGLIIAAVIAVVALIIKNWDTISRVTSELWNKVKALTSAAWDGIKGAVTAGISAVIGYFTGMPGRILGALGNLGGLLSGAGRAVIQGFLDGITGAFGRVRDTLSNLTSMLPDWKGPATRDAEILRNAGRLVMGGFDAGLIDKFGDVRRTLGGITADIRDLAGLRVGGPSFVQDRLGIGGGGTRGAQAAPAVMGGVTYSGTVYVVDPEEFARRTVARQRDAAVAAGLSSIL